MMNQYDMSSPIGMGSVASGDPAQFQSGPPAFSPDMAREQAMSFLKNLPPNVLAQIRTAVSQAPDDQKAAVLRQSFSQLPGGQELVAKFADAGFGGGGAGTEGRPRFPPGTDPMQSGNGMPGGDTNPRYPDPKRGGGPISESYADPGWTGWKPPSGERYPGPIADTNPRTTFPEGGGLHPYPVPGNGPPSDIDPRSVPGTEGRGYPGMGGRPPGGSAGGPSETMPPAGGPPGPGGTGEGGPETGPPGPGGTGDIGNPSAMAERRARHRANRQAKRARRAENRARKAAMTTIVPNESRQFVGTWAPQEPARMRAISRREARY